MIVAKPKESGVIKIDLTGSNGNAFYLMGVAKSLCKPMGKDADDVLSQMRSGDYEHLLKVFDREFGDFVILYRNEEDI